MARITTADIEKLNEICVQYILEKSVSLERPLTSRDIPTLVKEVRKSLYQKNPLYFSTAVRDYIVATFSNFFYKIVLMKEDDDSRSWCNLSGSLLKRIEDAVFKNFRPQQVSFEAFNKAVGAGFEKILRSMSWIIPCIFYEVEHNSINWKTLFKGMVYHCGEGIGNLPNPNSLEFQNRVLRITGPQELPENTSFEVEAPQAMPLPSVDENVTFVDERNRLNNVIRHCWVDLMQLKSRSELRPAELNFLMNTAKRLSIIDKDVSDFRIGIMGSVSQGKSTFINALVGCKGLLETSNGSTTKVCTEIKYTPGNFKVTLCFVSIKSIVDDYRYMKNELLDNQEKIDDEHYKFASNRLQYLFENVKGSNVKETLRPYDSSTIKYIGLNPIIHIEETAEKLGEWLNAHLQENKDVYLDTLEMIYIEGPFDTIPAGVVIIDSPGLEDRECSNSARSLEYMDSFDAIWYASNVSAALSTEDCREFLIRTRGYVDKEVHIIATKADGPNDRNEDTRNKFVRNVELCFYEEYIRKTFEEARAIDLCRSERTIRNAMKNAPAEIVQKINNRVNSVQIHFTAVDRDGSGKFSFGGEGWKNMLVEISSNKKRAVREHMAGLNSLTQAPRIKNVGDEIEKEWDSVLVEFETGLSQLCKDESLKALTTNVLNKFRSYGNIKAQTVRALMNSERCGFFAQRGSHRINRKFDINYDIACEWIAVSEHWREYLILQKLPDLLDSFREVSAPAACITFLQGRIPDVVSQLFNAERLKSRIANYFRLNRVYQNGRTILPTADEINNVCTRFLSVLVSQAVRNMKDAIRLITKDVDDIELKQDSPLYNILKTLKEELNLTSSVPRRVNTCPPPTYFTCSVTCKLLNNPYTARGCKQSNCNATVDASAVPAEVLHASKFLFNDDDASQVTLPLPVPCCPICRTTCDEFQPRYDMKLAIGLWKQLNAPFVHPIANWWEHLDDPDFDPEMTAVLSSSTAATAASSSSSSASAIPIAEDPVVSAVHSSSVLASPTSTLHRNKRELEGEGPDHRRKAQKESRE